MPLFPELLPHLEAAFDQAPEGAEFCINRYRSQDANLRSELHRIIRICKRPKSTWIERFSAAQNPAQ